jgi:hypothetical protein
MVRKGGLETRSEPNKYVAYIRSDYWRKTYGVGEVRPRPITALEEVLATIIHELTHAVIIEAGLREPKTKKAEYRREMQIDAHAYTFLGNDLFFENLFLEIRKRKNCSIVFNESAFDEDGRIKNPFLPYYLNMMERKPYKKYS